MRVEGIEIVPDPAAPQGGCAIVKLKGVWLLPPGTALRIEPAGAGQPTSRLRGWPQGDVRPRTVRVTGQGVEMIIGPEIVDAPALVPGTPVRLRIATLGFDHELDWPMLPISRPPRPGSGLSQLTPRDRPAPTGKPAAAPAVPPPSGAEQQAAAPASAKPAEPAQPEPTQAAAKPPPPPMPPPAPPPIPEPASSAGRASSPSGANLSQSQEPQEPAIRLPDRRSGLAGSLAIALASLSLGALAASAYRALPEMPGMASLEAGARLGADASPAGMSPRDRSEAPASQPGLATSAAPETQQQAASPTSIALLAQAFTAPDVSPRGVSAEARDTDAALLAANRSLHGLDGKPKDRQEAAFWLRTALSQQLEGPGMTWALTQLGALYASPDEGTPPDYDKARLLWEIAASHADPVANCFLGRLAEFGLGQPKDLAAARAHYAKAARLGGREQSGCRDLDEALARLSQ